MANLTKKKEHGSKSSFRFGNSYTWEYRNGLWDCAELRVEGSPWLSHLTQMRIDHMIGLQARYPMERSLWRVKGEVLLVDEAIPYEDHYFLRWHLDQLIEKCGFEIWNHVYDQTRLVQGMDTKEAEKLANKELTQWETLFS